MNQQDIDKAYVSPYDKLLFGFDASHPKTASQEREIDKHAKIAALRDHASPEPTDKTHWTDF